ncbi:MAG: hypothetical protein J6M34_06155 [Clostridia bacterium]|nr:hypothetical protein [Clostridia bacterium]
MKKILALTLALLLSLTCLAACNGGGNSPETLTAESIVGTWKGSMEGDVFGVALDTAVTIVFGADGSCKLTLDKDDMTDFYGDLFKSDGFLSEMGVTWAQFEQALAMQGLTLDDAIAQGVKSAGLSQESEYSFDGETLKMGGQKEAFTYEDGELILQEKLEGETVKIVLTKQ